MITVDSLHIYPVKSCRGVALDEAELARTGLAGDRLFQVVDGDGQPITQRQQPALATVQPHLDVDALRLDADGTSSIEITRPAGNDSTVQSLLGTPVEAADAGDAAAQWFSSLLGSECRLVAMTDESRNPLPIPGVEQETSFADAAGVLVASMSSLDWLVERSSEPFGMDRFRPNVTLTGAEPWDEDEWRAFTVGEAQLVGGIAWPRCAVPQVDQMTGDRHNEPARVLRSARWCAEAPQVEGPLRGLLEGNALFGIGCWAAPVGARIAVGDEVQVLDREASVIPPPSD